jgi:hypothetical protein
MDDLWKLNRKLGGGPASIGAGSLENCQLEAIVCR